MKGNIHHLGQEKQKKSNFLQLKSYKISGGTIGKIEPAYGLNSSGLTPQQAFNAKKAAAEAEKAKAEAEAAQMPIVQNEKIVAAVANVLNNSTKKTNNIQIANDVVNIAQNIAQVVAANVTVNKPTTKNNNNNNKKKYIKLLTNIRNGITNILPKE
jgi:hypothetical protein